MEGMMPPRAKEQHAELFFITIPLFCGGERGGGCEACPASVEICTLEQQSKAEMKALISSGWLNLAKAWPYLLFLYFRRFL